MKSHDFPETVLVLGQAQKGNASFVTPKHLLSNRLWEMFWE